MSGLEDLKDLLSQVADPLALLTGLFAHAPIGFQIYRADGHCLLTNQAFRDLFGGEPPPEYNVLEDDLLARGGVLELTRRAFAGETVTMPAIWYDSRKQPLRTGPGRRCAVACTAFPLLDARGGIAHVALVFKDVTDELLAREEAESERDRLRKSETRFSKVFRSLPMAALFSRMSDRRFVDVNDAWVRLTAFSREELIGRTSVELGLWTDVSRRAEFFQELDQRGFVRDFAAQLRQKSGTMRDVLLSVDRIELAGEDCLLLLGHDVTELRRLERDLRQSQKMEAIGRLAGGVAHDFNNILTAIGGADSLLLDGLAAADPLRRFAEQIKHSTMRAAALTRQLLTFTRKQPLQPVVLDPNERVRATADMLRRMIGAAVELRTELVARGRVKVDPGSLEQVILNLAINARDAMPAGGVLTLRTTDVEGGDGVPSGAWLLLGVADTGIGMDAQTRARLFEPFFTTKEQGKGTGLGLSTVYGIIRQSGGHIVVDSEPGRGSDFKIYLPRALELPVVERPAPSAAPLAGGRETVLLVEDDDAVRDFVSFVLSRLGYRVLEAVDGGEALKLANEFSEPIDLLLSDIVMPRMDGLELARRLAPLRPRMKVIHMSGYPGDAAEPQPAPGRQARFLNKPFERDLLAQRVRGVLDESE